MKKLILMATVFLSANTWASGDLYQRSVEIADIIYSHEHELSHQQASRTKQLFDEIEHVLRSSTLIECGEPNQIFKEAFQWARSLQGLGITKSEAQVFAQKIRSKNCPSKYLQVYQNSFEWAKSLQGLGATRSASMEFAEMLSDYEQNTLFSKNSLECVKEEYDFGRSLQGMGLSREEAKKFALNQCLGAQ
ncbi:MAG: hypothetical protein KDD22_09040 [Bdellovibrionales bacterium]|nr:hypothetical protein [Bdellovibrionales bacterium]